MFAKNAGLCWVLFLVFNFTSWQLLTLLINVDIECMTERTYKAVIINCFFSQKSSLLLVLLYSPYHSDICPQQVYMRMPTITGFFTCFFYLAKHLKSTFHRKLVLILLQLDWVRTYNHLIFQFGFDFAIAFALRNLMWGNFNTKYIANHVKYVICEGSRS